MGALDNVRARATGAFAPLTARVEAVLDSLSPRDRKLLLGLVGFGLVVVLGGGIFFMKSSLDSLDSELAARASDLQYLRLQQAEYESSQQSIQQIEDELRAHQGTAFTTFVDRAASNAQIRDSLRGIKESSESRLGSLEQKNHKVELTKVEIQAFFKFLNEMETAGYPLRITNASIKTVKVAGEKRLNVTLDVASFKLIEEEAEG